MKAGIGLLIVLCLSGCEWQQSVFVQLGPETRAISQLTWVLFIGMAVVMSLVMVLAAAAVFNRPRQPLRQWLSTDKTVFWLGLIFPLVTLTALQVYGYFILNNMPENPSAATDASLNQEPLRIDVIGEQWWWRVQYHLPQGQILETANEIHIPVDKPIAIHLTSADVIHSFWIPAFAGKMDMIPGRENILRFTVDTPATVRGQCAEYCGGAHALMGMFAVAHKPAGFEQWLKHEGEEGVQPQTALEQQGQALFLSKGCSGCHSIRGTKAVGEIGPDLTHVGSRLSLGAAVLGTEKSDFSRWIDRHQTIKPENLMPEYVFSQRELEALSEYLYQLQ